MSRRREVAKRQITPDPKYRDRLVAKFINALMFGGKKNTAERLVYRAFELLAEWAGVEDPLKLFKKAIDNVKPAIEVKRRRVGGTTYQVPVEVRPDRRLGLAIRWIIRCARERRERTMAERLANELLEAAENRGGAVKRKDDTHRMAEANRAFAHYRW